YGWSTVAASGFACAPGTGLAVTVAPGSLLAPGVVDASAYGTLAAVSSALVRQYASRDPITLAVPGAGATYTVYVTPATVDTDDTVLPFYNAADPSVTYAGADNSGKTAPTVRQDMAQTGIGASVPDGAYPLWTITVPAGATSITADMIAQAAGAPFYDTIPQLQAAKQDALGFTPVQQGGGDSQTTDKLYIGNASDIDGILRYRVGTTDRGPLISGQYGAVSANGDVPVYAQYWSTNGRPMVGYGETGAVIQWQPIATYADVQGVQANLTSAVAAQANENSSLQSQIDGCVTGTTTDNVAVTNLQMFYYTGEDNSTAYMQVETPSGLVSIPTVGNVSAQVGTVQANLTSAVAAQANE
ncbi:hypothetical protein, partial [Komagataeibacter europaeus]|uniref:hypothetical protein n=1 Tax=Komagataeibacter europaeus TaxID=33995 RepID=UPI000363CCFB